MPKFKCLVKSRRFRGETGALTYGLYKAEKCARRPEAQHTGPWRVGLKNLNRRLRASDCCCRATQSAAPSLASFFLVACVSFFRVAGVFLFLVTCVFFLPFCKKPSMLATFSRLRVCSQDFPCVDMTLGFRSVPRTGHQDCGYVHMSLRFLCLPRTFHVLT